MQAVVLQQPGRLEPATVPEPPDPGRGEALVAVRRVGVCGTDYHAYAGRQNFIAYPRILGHELAVEVVALGDDVGGVRVGERCAVLPYLPCGRCLACRRGRTNCCEQLQVLGVTVDGGLRERLVLPASALYGHPALSLDELALVETVGIGMHAVERAAPVAEAVALVIGAGPIGLAVCMCLAGRVSRIVVADLSAARLAFAASRLGVETLVVSPAARCDLRDVLAGDLPSVVIDATGDAASMEAAFELVASSGTLVFVGHTPGRLRFANPLFHRRELDVRASRNSLPSEWPTIIAALASGAMEVESWITSRSSLDAIHVDLPRLADSRDAVVKAVVEVGS